ncbi:hypothetical protein FSST1_006167 [Fusarium sambucinum]
MTKSASLLSLSPELIFQIIDHTNCPSTILPLALTCSALYSQCQPVLEQHREAYNKYKITSDLSPETVPHLLRDGPTAEIEQWHVRELEIWGSRESWRDWRPWAPELPGAYGLAEEAPSRSSLSTRDVQRLTRKGIELWDFFDFEISDAQENLQSGSDAYLKLLLVASCPRLHSIRFVNRPDDLWTSLFWIERTIQRSRSLGGTWSPGFQSIQNMAVGVSVGLSPDEEEQEVVHGSILATLLHLPHLKNLHICGVFQSQESEEEDEDFEFHEVYEFPISTSSVECLFLDSPSDLSLEFYDALASAPKDLDTLVIRARSSTTRPLEDIDTLVTALSFESPQLKRLIAYNGTGIHGNGVSSHLPTNFRAFEAMTHFSIAATDIEEEGYGITGNPAVENLQDEERQQAFPPYMEAIYVWGHTTFQDYEIDACENLDFLLARLIESGDYKDLKVIYVEHVERMHGNKINEAFAVETGQLAFPKTLAAGRDAGVHVYTLMNREDGGYWKSFPARPDRFDLKTGPCGERPADWRLNLYTGEWGPDCKGCGDCDKCLAVYPSEMWEKMKNGVAA